MVFNAPPAVRCIHWFCLRGGEPKSMHKIGLNRKIAKRLRLGPGQRQSQKSMHPSPSGASTSLGSSRMCIDFLVPFRNVHWFFGGSSQHVHRFSAESSTCASIFRGSSQYVRRYFWGSSQHVETDFPGKLLTCSSFLNENCQLDVHRYIEGVTNVSINFWQKFTTCASILLGSSEYLHRFSDGVLNMRAAILFWGSSQYVHRFSKEVPNMCMFFFWEVRIPNVHRYFGKITNIYWYLMLLLTWPTPFWGRKTKQIHRFFGNMSIDLQARYLICAPILRVPQIASIGYIYLWFNRNIILYLQKPNTEQKYQASHPPPRYMLLVRNS